MYFHIPQNSQLLQTHPQMIIQPLIDLAPVLEAEHKLYVLHLLYKYYTWTMCKSELLRSIN